ncbi:universal stress protein [Haloglomus litoreum]|uniref:universal stress protein n=1 Tax=Haloglomus litoreum TaxID=3034026 RepID=UPI0023E8EC15|nr:universal stress protein [Haloglomus sp. DT116]
MYHVVVAVAPEDAHVAEKVAAVTGLPGAADAVRVTLVHVAEPGTDVAAVPAVADALSLFAEAGVAAEAVRADGRPTEAVLRIAGERAADCICVAGREESPAGKRQLHPGAQQILLRADCPVLVTGDAPEGDADHV